MQLLKAPVEDSQQRKPINRHKESIVFDNISFAYSSKNEPAIKNISITIPHGERVAIVGPNGSGKTTLVSLLPRLLRPQVGSIFIDGQDIATVDLQSLRHQMGVVTQETQRFPL